MSRTWKRLSRGAYPLFYPPLHPHSTPISPCCRDEFLLRPAVHIITVVTAHWSVIHFSDLCIPITKWRLLSRLCVCPARALCRMLKWDKALEVTRVSALQDHIILPSLCLLVGLSACFWLSARHVDTVLFHPMLKRRADTVLYSQTKPHNSRRLCSEKIVGELRSGGIRALPTTFTHILSTAQALCEHLCGEGLNFIAEMFLSSWFDRDCLMCRRNI